MTVLKSLKSVDRYAIGALTGLSTVLLFLTSCAGGNGGMQTAAPPTRSAPSPRSILAELRSGQNPVQVATDNGTIVLESDQDDGWYRLQVPTGQTSDQFTKRLSRDNRITAQEQDQPVTTPEAGIGSVSGDPIHLPFDFTTTRDATYLSVAAGGPINQNAYRQVNLSVVPFITTGQGVIVAVLDTGIMTSHPDLSTGLLPGYNALAPQTSAEDIPDGTDNAAWGHGTMVAGVIRRIAPGARILPIRVLNADGQGSVLAVAKGIRYAVDHGARVINLSLGGLQNNGALVKALQKASQAGVVVVAAAGNSGTATLQYPAGLPNVIGVAALDATDQKAVFSNYGPSVSLAAPGVGIRSTYVNGGYATWSGTSFAAPFVSAAAALTFSLRPSYSGNAVTQQLLNTARSLDAQNPSYVGQLGRGKLDILRAVITSQSNQGNDD